MFPETSQRRGSQQESRRSGLVQKPFKKKKNKYKFVSQQQASNLHETKKTEQEPEKPETENKPEPDEDGFTKVVTKVCVFKMNFALIFEIKR